MAGIKKNVSTHIARHTFAYLADQSGIEPKRLQDMLEHSDINTTMHYATSLSQSDDLDKAMDKFVGWLRK